MFVLDTNIVSEMRRVRPHGAVLAWLANTDAADIYISAATVAEIQAGIERTREQDTAKALELELWLNQAVLSMNVLTADTQTFRTWAALMHRRQGHLWADAMTAASAIQYSATVVTRNTKDFLEFGVPLFNPFAQA